MLFSDYYGVDISNGSDWFDPILDYDTKLFIDPFLVTKRTHVSFKKSNNLIQDFFNKDFTLAATTSRNKGSLKYQRLLQINTFPEVKELCLGFSNNGTKGLGAGSGFGELIVSAILDSIDRGVVSLPHFEELGIFNRGFGADRVSDITANLIKRDLITYTQKISATNNIPIKKFSIRVLDRSGYRWNTEDFLLPENPYSNNQGVILIPKRFINNIPSINDDDFYNYCTIHYNASLRLELNTTALSDINKEDIIKIAKKHRKWIDKYLSFKEKIASPKSYDLEKDPKGYYIWAKYTRQFVEQNPLTLAAHNAKSFTGAMDKLVTQFKNYLELNGGHKLLWNDGGRKPKTEEATQLLFFGIGKTYCSANDIDITREAEMGRGPVDFKFSSGYKNRLLLEVKLAKNGKFWHGLEKQFIYYLTAEDIKVGYFMIICFDNKDFLKVQEIGKQIDRLNAKHKMNLTAVVIDCTYKKPSASNIK